jgi:hypothetical protein
MAAKNITHPNKLLAVTQPEPAPTEPLSADSAPADLRPGASLVGTTSAKNAATADLQTAIQLTGHTESMMRTPGSEPAMPTERENVVYAALKLRCQEWFRVKKSRPSARGKLYPILHDAIDATKREVDVAAKRLQVEHPGWLRTRTVRAKSPGR